MSKDTNDFNDGVTDTSDTLEDLRQEAVDALSRLEKRKNTPAVVLSKEQLLANSDSINNKNNEIAANKLEIKAIEKETSDEKKAIDSKYNSFEILPFFNLFEGYKGFPKVKSLNPFNLILNPAFRLVAAIAFIIPRAVEYTLGSIYKPIAETDIEEKNNKEIRKLESNNRDLESDILRLEGKSGAPNFNAPQFRGKSTLGETPNQAFINKFIQGIKGKSGNDMDKVFPTDIYFGLGGGKARESSVFREAAFGSEKSPIEFSKIGGAQIIQVWERLIAIPEDYESEGLGLFSVDVPEGQHRLMEEFAIMIADGTIPVSAFKDNKELETVKLADGTEVKIPAALGDFPELRDRVVATKQVMVERAQAEAQAQAAAKTAAVAKAKEAEVKAAAKAKEAEVKVAQEKVRSEPAPQKQPAVANPEIAELRQDIARTNANLETLAQAMVQSQKDGQEKQPQPQNIGAYPQMPMMPYNPMYSMPQMMPPMYNYYMNNPQVPNMMASQAAPTPAAAPSSKLEDLVVKLLEDKTKESAATAARIDALKTDMMQALQSVAANAQRPAAKAPITSIKEAQVQALRAKAVSANEQYEKAAAAAKSRVNVLQAAFNSTLVINKVSPKDIAGLRATLATEQGALERQVSELRILESSGSEKGRDREVIAAKTRVLDAEQGVRNSQNILNQALESVAEAQAVYSKDSSATEADLRVLRDAAIKAENDYLDVAGIETDEQKEVKAKAAVVEAKAAAVEAAKVVSDAKIEADKLASDAKIEADKQALEANTRALSDAQNRNVARLKAKEIEGFEDKLVKTLGGLDNSDGFKVGLARDAMKLYVGLQEGSSKLMSAEKLAAVMGQNYAALGSDGQKALALEAKQFNADAQGFARTLMTKAVSGLSVDQYAALLKEFNTGNQVDVSASAINGLMSKLNINSTGEFPYVERTLRIAVGVVCDEPWTSDAGMMHQTLRTTEREFRQQVIKTIDKVDTLNKVEQKVKYEEIAGTASFMIEPVNNTFKAAAGWVSEAGKMLGYTGNIDQLEKDALAAEKTYADDTASAKAALAALRRAEVVAEAATTSKLTADNSLKLANQRVEDYEDVVGYDNSDNERAQTYAEEIVKKTDAGHLAALDEVAIRTEALRIAEEKGTASEAVAKKARKAVDDAKAAVVDSDMLSSEVRAHRAVLDKGLDKGVSEFKETYSYSSYVGFVDDDEKQEVVDYIAGLANGLDPLLKKVTFDVNHKRQEAKSPTAKQVQEIRAGLKGFATYVAVDGGHKTTLSPHPRYLSDGYKKVTKYYEGVFENLETKGEVTLSDKGRIPTAKEFKAYHTEEAARKALDRRYINCLLQNPLAPKDAKAVDKKAVSAVLNTATSTPGVGTVDYDTSKLTLREDISKLPIQPVYELLKNDLSSDNAKGTLLTMLSIHQMEGLLELDKQKTFPLTDDQKKIVNSRLEIAEEHIAIRGNQVRQELAVKAVDLRMGLNSSDSLKISTGRGEAVSGVVKSGSVSSAVKHVAESFQESAKELSSLLASKDEREKVDVDKLSKAEGKEATDVTSVPDTTKGRFV